MNVKNHYTDTIIQLERIFQCFLSPITSELNCKNKYLRNCIAKTLSLLRTIDLLYLIKKHNECWIIYRSLIDRLVYLYYLTDTNSFVEFDKWTYIQLFEYRHNAKVDENYKKLLGHPLFVTNPDEANFYKELKDNNVWKKPKPQDILKSQGLNFLYKYGYDYASMHTHPMSWDGDREFYSLTGFKPNPYDALNDKLIMDNSLIITSIILNFILINIDIEVPKILVSYLSEFKKLTEGNENNFNNQFQEVYDYFKHRAGC